ncbi:TonB-dependent receptor [candidate division KSB1 bacterium]|nr:TonB-dependent receptor [candidate division KSB1 bacterium]
MLILFAIGCLLSGGIMFDGAFGGTTGKISGRILDKATGDALPMANIVLVGTTIGASTDLDGYYSILQVPPGVYSLRATMMGYNTVTQTNVQVRVDLTTPLNFKLEPTVLDLGKEITIVAERPVIQLDETSSSHRISRETIENMGASDALKLVTTQAGVVGEGMHINVRGGRTGEILTVVDGQSVRDPLFSQATRTTSEQVMDFSANPVDEMTSRSGGMSVPANAIAEMEIIKGGYNAEYGEALSAIINVVTREGGPKFSGRLNYMTDDFHQAEFRSINSEGSGLRRYSHKSNRFEFDFGGPVPFLTKILPVRSVSFFVSGTGNFSNLTSAFDVPYYAPTGEDRSEQLREHIWGIKLPFKYGDFMDNTYGSLTNLAIRFTPNLKLTLKYQSDISWYDEYNHAFRLIPENFFQRNEKNRTATAKWNHTMSPSTYYEVLVGYYHTRFHMQPGDMDPDDIYNYWDALDGRLGDGKGRQTVDDDQDGFYEAGFPARATWHDRETKKWTWRTDLTSQIHRSHNLKTGFEVNHYKMYLGEIKYPYTKYDNRKIDNGPWPELGIFRDFYTRYPTTIMFYAQDKIEYQTLIINLGVRWEMWSPGKQVNQSVEGDKLIPGQELEYKQNIMPRLGISHPITDLDKLYFYFGRFTQAVDWNFLYIQDTQSSNAFKLYGNPNLESQQVTSYELGIEHGFNDVLTMKVAGFFKDYSGLVNTETRGTFETYSVYVNRDYASSRGFEVNFTKNMSNYTSGHLNYTYLYAMGKSSSYRQGYDYAYRGQPIPIREWPLDWDVRHSINIMADFRVPKGQAPTIFGLVLPDNWGVNLIWKIESGKPYTPTGRSADQYTTHNSARTPYRAWTDLRINKDYRFYGIGLSMIMEIENLFNRRNVRAVNTGTGDPLGLMRPEDISPAAFCPGRNIMLGASLEW